jgi:hypothetical protein
VGLFFVDFGLAPDDGIGLLVTYRGTAAPTGLGMRFAATRGEREDDPHFSGGIDAAIPMIGHSPTFPLDVIWTTGVGASYSDYLQLAAPVGFSAGRALEGPTIWFNPYVSTRAVFELYLGDEAPEDEFGMALAADLGFDVAFGRRRAPIFRLATSLGDRHAIVAGIHLRL